MRMVHHLTSRLKSKMLWMYMFVILWVHICCLVSGGSHAPHRQGQVWPRYGPGVAQVWPRRLQMFYCGKAAPRQTGIPCYMDALPARSAQNFPRICLISASGCSPPARLPWRRVGQAMLPTLFKPSRLSQKNQTAQGGKGQEWGTANFFLCVTKA